MLALAPELEQPVDVRLRRRSMLVVERLVQLRLEPAPAPALGLAPEPRAPLLVPLHAAASSPSVPVPFRARFPHQTSSRSACST